MEQNKVKGYGVRGWLLIIWIATAFLAYTAIGNYPLNVLSDLYGGQQTLSNIYTGASIAGIVIQLIASNFIGRLKSIKKSRAMFPAPCRWYGVLFTVWVLFFLLCMVPSHCPS